MNLKNKSIKLLRYDLIFLELSWGWLNDPQIKTLTNSSDFTREDQINWYNNLVHINNYKIWGIKYDDFPIGACGLKAISEFDAEYWGYIGEKQYWGMGFGNVILNLIEEKAEEMNLKSLWLRVSCNNLRAIRLYTKNGYIEELNENNLIIMRKSI